MRLFRLEIKRVLKSKMTWILLAAAMALSVVLAYLPATFPSGSYTDENGKKVEMTRLDKIRRTRQNNGGLQGEVTPQKIREAVEVYQFNLNKYGVNSIYDLPEEVYYDEISVYAPLVHGIQEAFADPDTGMPGEIQKIDPEEVEVFYEKCRERLSSLVKMEQRNYPSAQKKAEEMYSKVTFPFTYYYGISDECMDYQTILIFFITIFCAVIAAPVFSSDYQTGADDILRCTRHGRVRLGIVKVLSALLICTVSFSLCLTVWILITNSLFGWESTKTSMQMIYSVSSLLNFNMGQLEWFNMSASLLSFLAAVSFALFLSSRMKGTVPSLAMALMFCVLPLIVYMGIPGAAGDWIRCILPGGGIGLQNSLLYGMIDLEFLHLGNHFFWNVCVMIAAAVVEIPLFCAGAVISYCRHRGSV